MATTTELTQVPLDLIVPYERNAKKHPQEQVDKIKASMEEFGFVSPCLIDRDYNLIAGHGRVEAAKALGMETVPCVFVEGLTETQRKAYILADNKLTELGGWDMEIVEQEMQELAEAGFETSLTGFDWDAATSLGEIEEDEYDPAEEETVPAIVSPGDIWILGDHRLMCGDSTSEEDMDRLLDGELADFVFTDPPYGVDVGKKNRTLNESGFSVGNTDSIENDDIPQDELYEILVQAFTNLRTHAKDECSYYVASPAGENLIMMLEMMRDAGLEVRHTLAWVKNNSAFGLLGLDYKYRHEVILYTWTKGHKFRGGYDQTVIDDSGQLEGLGIPELKELVHALRGDGGTSTIFCDKPTSSKLHPTMKPVKLVARFMYNSSKPGDNVVDIFGGSGSTMIAAEQLKRRCFMMELDPHYCDVIIYRWQEYTGEKAVKANG